MTKYLLLLTAIVFAFQGTLIAQEEEKDEGWKFGGGLGLDFAQMLLINPKVGAGENRIGIGGNTSFYANYKKGRFSWKNLATINFSVQRLGRGKKIPFQKALDEFRITSAAALQITDDNPFAYALDFLMLTQLTPTYDGNYLSRQNSTSSLTHPIAQFFSPATIALAPGIAYKPDEHLSVLLSPATFKATIVGHDSIAMLGRHGNPHGGTSEQEFRDNWKVKPKGLTPDSVYYANSYFQLGATLKATYSNKFWKYKEGDKEKHRIGLTTSLTLFSNYLREPQNIDVEWLMNVDFYIFKGLSISLGTNLFYDHDVMMQVDRDGDINTGVNGYESTGRRLSFTETLLIKYNYMF
ncbi:MAG: DUF3078 domain-containing protein [Aureispira sp.]|nr:DUF3078 domain-containing protein [Aureispira sp.]